MSRHFSSQEGAIAQGAKRNKEESSQAHIPQHHLYLSQSQQKGERAGGRRKKNLYSQAQVSPELKGNSREMMTDDQQWQGAVPTAVYQPRVFRFVRHCQVKWDTVCTTRYGSIVL